jgi:UDP-glucuronate decarboxylase
MPTTNSFLALLDSDVTSPTNIGNTIEFTIAELAELVTEMIDTGSKVTYHDLPVDDPTQRKPDITKARELLGWEPTVQLREGLEDTIAYFDQLLKS